MTDIDEPHDFDDDDDGQPSDVDTHRQEQVADAIARMLKDGAGSIALFESAYFVDILAEAEYRGILRHFAHDIPTDWALAEFEDREPHSLEDLEYYLDLLGPQWLNSQTKQVRGRFTRSKVPEVREWAKQAKAHPKRDPRPTPVKPDALHVRLPDKEKDSFLYATLPQVIAFLQNGDLARYGLDTVRVIEDVFTLALEGTGGSALFELITPEFFHGLPIETQRGLLLSTQYDIRDWAVYLLGDRLNQATSKGKAKPAKKAAKKSKAKQVRPPLTG
ncbi:MAG TPA: hypothetical protein VNJ04_10240 [Gemmatimonadaceae bacterium]|nr:hypothetical protein [Gemmatimonadaceae bacterium]